MSDITHVAGVTWGHPQTASFADESDLRLLADEMEIDPIELVKRARKTVDEDCGVGAKIVFNGLALPTILIEKRHRRIAPAALRIAPYHRALWDLRLLPADIETGTLLIERCQNNDCDGKPLAWQHTLGIDFCEHCMSDLKGGATDYLPSDVYGTLQGLAEFLDLQTRPGVLGRLTAQIGADNGQLAIDMLVRLLPLIDRTIHPTKKHSNMPTGWRAPLRQHGI